jgi:hypothetical protein
MWTTYVLGSDIPPLPMLDHVAGCNECKVEILELVEVMALVWADVKIVRIGGKSYL